MSVLDEIMAHKRDEVAQQQARRPLAEVRAAARSGPAAARFRRGAARLRRLARR